MLSQLRSLTRGVRRVPRSTAIRIVRANAINKPRYVSEWVRSFWLEETQTEAFARRGPEVDQKELGVPKPIIPEGTPLRTPNSLRPEWEPQRRFQVPGEEEKYAKERFEELFRGIGVHPVRLDTKYYRLDEYGNPVPLHLRYNFEKSRKVIDEFDVVIVGSGPAGLAVAQHLGGKGMANASSAMNDEGNVHLPLNYSRFSSRVLIIDPQRDHYYQPMWTLVGGGKRELVDSVRRNADLVAGMQHDVQLLDERVDTFLPHENALLTAEGRKVTYKQLVVAAGLEVKVNKIKGLSDAIGRAGVSSNYVYPYAQRTWDFIRFFPGGNAIFTVPSGPIKCAGAPQKIMYMAEDFWRRHVGRELSNIKFVSGGPRLFGVPHYEQALKQYASSVGLNDMNFGLNLVEIDYRGKQAIFERVLASADGSVGDRVSMPYDFLHVTPPQGPYKFIADSELADSNGWVDVDKHTLQHSRFPNVFALGDCSSAPTSKTAAAAGAQARIVAENVIRYRESRPATTYAQYDGYTACPFVLGGEKSIFAEFDYSGQPRETFPVDGATPSGLLYHIKEEWFPHVYWDRLLQGKHDMAQYRRWFGTTNKKVVPAAASS